MSPLGLFDSHGDIGAPRLAGSVVYDATSGLYTLTAAGVNMWDVRDEFHFVWTRITGDFAIETQVAFIGASAEKHRKAGCIARASLGDGSAYADAALHAGDGLTSLQVRRTAGAVTEQIVAPIQGADRIRFERSGLGYRFLAARGAEPWVETSIDGLDLGDTLYVGLFLCSHNADTIEQATFDRVRLER